MADTRKTRPSGDAPEREMDTHKSVDHAALHSVHNNSNTFLNGFQDSTASTSPEASPAVGLSPGDKLGLSVKEAAALLSLSPPMVYRLIEERHDFPAFKVSSKIVISRELLAEWVRRQAGQEAKAL